MKNSGAISALIGGTFFAIPYLALSIPALPSLVIGGAAFVAGELVLSKTSNDIYDIPSGNFKKTLDRAKKQNRAIKEIAHKIEDNNIVNKLEDIYNTVDNIISTVEENPKKVKKINNFFDYYLPLTVKIIDRYDQIEDRKLSSKDSKTFIKSTNEMIEEIDSAFKKILNKLYESDIIDTDAEMKTFNSLLKADGFDRKEIEVLEDDSNE